MWAFLLVSGVLSFAQIQPRTAAVYTLDGYLDQAPAGQTVMYHAVIGFGPKNRNYLVTDYTLQGEGNPFEIFRNLGMFQPDFILLGPKEDLQKLIDAKPGSRVSGRFLYMRGMHNLQVDPYSLKIQ
jgi:hypothetical protein